MYIHGKTIFVESILGMRGGGMKNSGGSASKYMIFDIL
jgi:hypothetical protein